MKSLYLQLTIFLFAFSYNFTFAQDVDINGPIGSGSFGNVSILANGNFVVVDPLYDEGATADVGAVYLYDGATKTLISTLKGSTANDQVGSGGIQVLSNGNYIVISRLWDNGAAVDAGAVTWCDGTTGINGTVSSSNSLVGSTTGDQVGNNITELTNGNYVVASINWANGAATNAGAVTWGDGTTGISGTVSSSNSLVGSTTSDGLGSTFPFNSILALTNGNYVVTSRLWDNGAITNAGAVTWGDGTTGITGIISSSNSLVGSTANDRVGWDGSYALTNGNYVVASRNWNNGLITSVGAVTWGDGTTGISGIVSSSNSLVGSTANDQIGRAGANVLTNGNYVVASITWANGAATNAGAVTWGDGTTGISGIVSSSNSLVGSTSGDFIGSRITVLANGNYIAWSREWSNGAILKAGAVTWGNGTIGITGIVSSSNSLVGSTANDQVGDIGATALTNGNYVVGSRYWDNGLITDAGAVTWGDGTTGITGIVSSSNSLVGSNVGDQVGSNGGANSIVALTNGNYVVVSRYWDNAGTSDAGAVTWGDGTIGITGIVSSSNSLVGSTINDQVGNVTGGGIAIAALTNGNYVVRSSLWDNAGAPDAGAVTWGDGTTGITGIVSSSNSLVGSTLNDQVGVKSLTQLNNGNYVVTCDTWDNGGIADVGAITWGDGTIGITGVITSSNSLVGSTAGDKIGSISTLPSSPTGVTALTNGNYTVRSRYWDNGGITDAGAVTWGNGTTGITGIVSSSNSLVGSTINDQVGVTSLAPLTNGNYVVRSQFWDNGATIDAGAVSLGDGSIGLVGNINSCNSVIGEITNEITSSVFNNTNDYLIVQKNLSNKLTLSNKLFQTTINSSTICANESIVINGTTYSAANPSGTEVFSTLNGCDSTVTVSLNVLPVFTGVNNSTICANESIVINGTTYSAANPSGTEVFSALNGCDSTVTVSLNVLPVFTGVNNSTICANESIVINGTTYSAANPSGIEVFSALNGCDSTVSVSLNVLPVFTGVNNSTICANESIVINGTAYSAANPSGTEVFSALNGCDSTVTVSLNVLPVFTGVNNSTICANESIVINGTTYSAANPSGTEVFSALNGCDSTVIVNLTIMNTASGVDIQSACGNYTWINGITYTSSTNTPIYVISNGSANGCDSIVTLNLTLATVYTTTFTSTSCISYMLPSGSTIYTSGIYYDTLQAINGCDSLFVINATIYPVDTLVTQNVNTLIASATSGAIQWINCATGINVFGATGNIFTSNYNGTFAAVIFQNGCYDTTSCFVINSLDITEEEYYSEDLKIYPNPTLDKITIEIPKTMVIDRIELYDNIGRVIQVISEINSIMTLNLSTLADGTYYVLFKSDHIGNKTIPVVKN